LVAEQPGPSQPLIETVVTTLEPNGDTNCAAMGVRWGDEELTFWPFQETRTLSNLRARGEAVVHLTDDALLFVQSALGHPQPATRAAAKVAGAVIEDCSAWREVAVIEITEPAGELPRWCVRARVVAAGTGSQPPLGMCRARYAVIEASIVASRLRRLGLEGVVAELDRLQDLIDRTAGPRERAAMDYVRDYVTQRS
jgi:hypothetical protein